MQTSSSFFRECLLFGNSSDGLETLINNFWYRHQGGWSHTNQSFWPLFPKIVFSRLHLIIIYFWGGPCSGRWFLVRFSDLILGSQDNGFIQERGVVAGTRVGVVILVPVFLGALVAVFLVVLVFFGRYLGCNSVPGQGLDSCVVVWLPFFVAVLVGPFVAVLVVVFLFAFV